MNIEIDKQKKIKSLEARMNGIPLRFAVFLNEKKLNNKIIFKNQNDNFKEYMY